MADRNDAHDSTELDSPNKSSPPSGSPGAGELSPTSDLMREFFGDDYDTELDPPNESSPPLGSPLQAGAGGLSPTPDLMRELFGDDYDNLELVNPQTIEPDLEHVSTLESDPIDLPTLENNPQSPTFSEIMRDPLFLLIAKQRSASPTLSEIMGDPVCLPMAEQRNASPTFSEIMRNPVYFPPIDFSPIEQKPLSPTLSDIMREVMLADTPNPVYPEPPSLLTDPVIPYFTDIPWLPEDDFNFMLQLEPKRVMVNRSTALQMNLPSRRLPNIPTANPNFLLHGSTGRPSPSSTKGARSRADSFDPETNALSTSESETEGLDRSRKSKPVKALISTRTTRLTKSTDARPSTATSISRDAGKRDAAKPWVREHAVKGLNCRTALIVNYKPEDYYKALVRTPASWGAFRYTPHGELQAGRFYSVEEIEQYLFSPHHRGLILWIQKNPSDSARRYPTKTSARCRFEECFAIKNCINQGQYRVAFDEQSYKEADTDPQHNAGYVHLYCLEKLLDFPDICAQLDVCVEDRDLPDEPEGKNRMLMSSDLERSVAKKFITRCERTGPPPGYPSHQMRNRPHEGTLTHSLSVAKMQTESARDRRSREARGLKGSMISEHLGNLETYAVERDKSRRVVNQNRKEAAPVSRKRARAEEEDEGSDGEFIVVAPAKKGRLTRRTRRRRYYYTSSSDDED
ncbi:MAG: hypothetical protein Q9187_002670 [Circinaria calcarea]